MLSDAIIHNALKLAQEGAEKLDRSLEGHERDFPHKNRSHVKEFTGYMSSWERGRRN